ncbi:2-keto-4-pentenoate hydratase/2-oxohepta-3-ene-1,7-dioic acid hydratase (catechol pathway) [Paramicrobacterium humi]|uniref:2-keto-4-pentenoate hydratase/2-oxohepta-3-ene-1,7-dioic acid hydratase (Catechol pathway) n=2 Tax=Paramicrobacterium humi TaxID=640635 RepID=A0A1H4PMV2_9MICO|nr:2-keto-4-pentenoate hydratase/2-oxohepta-3-ene-1,7-dioic acid hydratase (catechol pathway) [Microbacterium humi]
MAAGGVRLAVVEGENALFLDEILDDAPSTLQVLLDRGPDELDRVRAMSEAAFRQGAETAPISDLDFDSAVLTPPAVIAIGLNYSAHSSELKLKADQAPTVFTLWPNSLNGHLRTTTWPRALSEAIDYEAELGVIIGTAAHDVSEDEALDYVFGYTVVNDITARDIQYSEAQWTRCKSFDGFTPTGPVVVTADEVPDPQDLRITTVLDGHMMQDSSTGLMVRSVAKLVSYLSRSTTLLPGTLISTGSPGGAGYSRDPQVFLRDRSTVTVAVSGIGELTTHCRMF